MDTVSTAPPPMAPTPSRFEDRPAALIGLAVPGVKNTAENATILAALYSTGLGILLDDKRHVVRVIYDADELDTWNATRPLTLPSTATIAEARALFAQTGRTLIPITRGGHYSGSCASLIQLQELDTNTLRPARIGGLATPLGVYLTTGKHTGGAGLKGMLVLGVIFGIILTALEWLSPVVYSGVVALFPQFRTIFHPEYIHVLGWLSPVLNSLFDPHLIEQVFTYNRLMWVPKLTLADILQMGFMMMAMLALMNLTPLSALHAAEHMTVHAVEADLKLDEETVRKQPRAHPRCGTNLAVVLFGLQLPFIFFYNQLMGKVAWYGVALYLALWGAGLWFYWHRAGMWIQWNFTTRKPNDAELASGIKAGNEVLEKFAADPHQRPSIWQRLWTMGAFQLLTATFITIFILQTGIQLALILSLNGWDWHNLPPRWWEGLL